MARTAPRWLDPAAAALAALGAATALLGYPPAGGWGIAVAAPAILWAHAVRSSPRRAFAGGFVYGLGFFSALLYWLTGTLHNYGYLSIPTSLTLFALLVAYLSLYPAFCAWALARLGGRGWGGALAAAPFLWTGMEGLRGWFLSGFGWGAIPQAMWRTGWALDLAPWIGADGVGLLLAGIASAPAWALLAVFARRAGARRPSPAALLPAGVSAALIAVLLLLPRPGGEVAGRGRAAIVQGNVPQEEKWDPDRHEEIFRRYRDLTFEAAAEGKADFVVWPETALPVYLEKPSRESRRVLAVAREAGVPVILGGLAVERAGGRVEHRNSVFLIDRFGKLKGRYDKVHLVPFGEYVPWGEHLPFLHKLTQGSGDFTPGAGVVTLRENGDSPVVGPLICFESIFSEYAADHAAAGAEVLVVVTNDAWFGRTSAPWQHLAYSAWRAAENGLWLVRAANTGVSAVFDDRGRLVTRTDLMKTGTLVAEVEYRRPGALPQAHIAPWIWPLSLALALARLFAILRRRPASDRKP